MQWPIVWKLKELFIIIQNHYVQVVTIYCKAYNELTSKFIILGEQERH